MGLDSNQGVVSILEVVVSIPEVVVSILEVVVNILVGHIPMVGSNRQLVVDIQEQQGMVEAEDRLGLKGRHNQGVAVVGMQPGDMAECMLVEHKQLLQQEVHRIID